MELGDGPTSEGGRGERSAMTLATDSTDSNKVCCLQLLDLDRWLEN